MYLDTKEFPPLFLTMPPYYIEWFQLEFPHVKIEGPPPYVVQVFNYMQGTKNAGNRYFAVLSGLFEKLNLRPTSVDRGVFVCVEPTTNYILIVLSNVDDCLVFSSNQSLSSKLEKILRTAYDITIQKGSRIKFLNFQIIQSEYGFSIDQIEHILNLVNYYFPKNTSVKHTDTPLRSDRQFNIEMAAASPASPDELNRLKK